jgi:hypothetical protein
MESSGWQAAVQGVELLWSIVAVAALAIALVLAVAVWFAFRAVQRLTLANALLEQRVAALQDQQQRELLAMGQRVLVADKSLNRLEDRLGRLENMRPGDTQYGQLEAILSKVAAAGNREEVSVAEEQLRSLLQQRSK